MALAGQPQAEVWFSGTVDAAFAKARAEKSLVFLYWGAVWCPPCNELKANVFSKPRFAELMKNFVPVYLDGDTEEAQVWGERLQTSGYPTVLVLDAEKKELFRLGSSVNMGEFEDALQAMLGQSQNFQTAIASLKADKVSDSSWKLLAFADWEQLPKEYGDRKERLELVLSAARKCPAKLKQEKALLEAASLSMLVSMSDPERPKATAEDKAQLLKLLSSEDQLFALRSFIVNQSDSILEWLKLDLTDPQYKSIKHQWLTAAQKIAVDPRVSVDTRLGALNPELSFYQRENPKGAVSAELQKKVQDAVRLADYEAKTDFERHAVISGAAYYLRRVGDVEGARKLLVKEVEKTNTPWYYQSSLANLEWEAGRSKEAQTWAAKARQSAQGRATKIQWITNDILLNAKIVNEENKLYLKALAKEYYELATELPDGFSGRNKARSLKVQEALTSLKGDNEFKKMLGNYEQRCQSLKSENQQACLQHFQSYR